jgi:hypothetical protein
VSFETIANLKGPQGIQGPRGLPGLPGVNGVANDAAMAALLANPGSDTAGALSALQGAVYAEGSGTGSLTLAALQQACDTAKASGRFAVASGTITTSTTLVIDCDADLSALTINYTGTGVAVQLGSETDKSYRLSVHLPRLLAANKASVGWAEVAGTVGVYAVNLDSCAQITVPYIRGFETGLLVYGKGQGNSYNTYMIGHLHTNQRNLVVSADATGWSNQNTFVGGRYGHNSSEGVGVAGVEHILMVSGLAHPPNNNLWLNPSLEGIGTPIYCASFTGQNNVIINGRYEAPTPKVLWAGAAKQNMIIGGYNADTLTDVVTGGVPGAIITGEVMRNGYNYANSLIPYVQLENRSGGDRPVLGVYDAGAREGALGVVDRATAWNMLVAATKVQMKRRADASAQVAIEYTGNVRVVGVLQSGAGATGSRPSASTAGAGAMFYDTTLSKPIWSNGSVWKDAAGTTV